MSRAAIILLVAVSWHASAQQAERNCDPDAGLVDAWCLTKPPRTPRAETNKTPPSITGISSSLQAAIRRLSPTARVLQASEIDMRECEQVPRTPGLVKADFNGDGFEDAAVLLKTHVASEVKTWEGQTYREANLVFVIFLSDGKGGYLTPTQDKYKNLIPAMLFLDVIPPGKVRDIEAGKDVVLQNPGVMLTFCGKSAAAYAVTGSTVKEIPLSD